MMVVMGWTISMEFDDESVEESMDVGSSDDSELTWMIVDRSNMVISSVSDDDSCISGVMLDGVVDWFGDE